MSLPKAAHCNEVEDKEVLSLEKQGVCELIPISFVRSSQKIVGTRWITEIKADGASKSRLVVQGWSQVHGIDYGGPFSPVCRLQSICMMLVNAAELVYGIYMMDFQTAFLNVDVQEERFVKMPPGYERSDKAGVPLIIMKLKESIYGLRQSPKNWFGTMDEGLGDIGFHPLKSDPCVYIYEDVVGFLVLLLYADDLLLLGANKLLLNTLKKQLMDRFEMTDMGDVSRGLGVKVVRNRKNGTITINQRDYTTVDVIERFGMKGCNLAYTPGVGPELSPNQSEEKLLDEEGKKRYQPITGVLSCNLGRFPATASSLPLTSWRGQCPSLQKPTWERLITYFTT